MCYPQKFYLVNLDWKKLLEKGEYVEAEVWGEEKLENFGDGWGDLHLSQVWISISWFLEHCILWEAVEFWGIDSAQNLQSIDLWDFFFTNWSCLLIYKSIWIKLMLILMKIIEWEESFNNSYLNFQW